MIQLKLNSVKVLYEPTRDLVLEARDWTFAAARASITPLTDPPPFGYSAQFQLPSDFLVVRQLSDDPIHMRPIDYVKEQKLILCDVDILYIKYTARITDTNKFSPACTHAIAHKLAAAIANPLTSSSTLKKEMEAMGQAYIDDGGATDGTQSKPGRTYATKVVGARLR